jgi:hypothetical protein
MLLAEVATLAVVLAVIVGMAAITLVCARRIGARRRGVVR